jgi:hypothetical protein
MNMIELNIPEILSALKKNGVVVIDDSRQLFSSEEWEEIERLVFSEDMPYETVHIGDAGEPNCVEVGRLMVDVDYPRVMNEVVSRRVLDILGSDRRMTMLNQLTGHDDLHIRRAQVNLMHAGSFIGLHVDQDSNPDYEVAVVLQLGREFAGGEFVVHPPEGDRQVIQSAFRSVTVARCDFAHEVKQVTDGVRASLVFFVAHHSDKNRRLDS